MAEPIQTQTPQNQQQSFKTLSDFQLKALLVAMLVVFLPILSSEAPDFVKQALSNKMWELFHLLLVGIAIAYGLFSRKCADQETERGNASDSDNAQGFVSDMLDGLPVFDSTETHNPNVQSWSSMYNPNEPLVVLENEIMDGIEQKINKPLFLPVRSLKPVAQEPELLEEDEEIQNDGNAEVPNSTHEEEKGDHFKLSSFSDSGRPMNKQLFRSLTTKEPSNSRKITPDNFRCVQDKFSTVGKPVETARLKRSSSMDQLIKKLEESESDDASFDEEEEGSSNSSSCVTDDGKEENEVDKKANEFIAKFREQIRQQRMQCRKRSTIRKGGGK